MAEVIYTVKVKFWTAATTKEEAIHEAAVSNWTEFEESVEGTGGTITLEKIEVKLT